MSQALTPQAPPQPAIVWNDPHVAVGWPLPETHGATLDALAASALGGPIYTGPSLGGAGLSPGIAVAPSLGTAPAVASASSAAMRAFSASSIGVFACFA